MDQRVADYEHWDDVKHYCVHSADPCGRLVLGVLRRLDDPELTIVDCRRADEFTGKSGYPCDPRQGHIPGALHLEVGLLFAGPGTPARADEIQRLVGAPEGAEVVVYCHSGSRSALAAMALRSAGYRARNYPGSWHEWSRHDDLSVET
jgi:thiosulfate/3-mercaptopyruvate sulfurtransferase